MAAPQLEFVYALLKNSKNANAVMRLLLQAPRTELEALLHDLKATYPDAGLRLSASLEETARTLREEADEGRAETLDFLTTAARQRPKGT